MKKIYFTEEEKKEAKKRWRKNDYYKHREKRLIQQRENHYKHREERLKSGRERYREYRKNPIYIEKQKERHRINHIIQRKICIEHYSNGKNCCELCGESDLDVLTLDHINGGGNQHRKKIGYHTSGVIITNKFPEGYRILCMNCNMKEAKRLKLYGTKQFLK